MRELRLANAHYLSAVPFRVLSGLAGIRYEENSARENARKLHENQVDVALIPVAEFASHGGYVGLDFGIACREKSECVMLYANSPIESLQTIYLYEGASTAALLLKMCLLKVWKASPRLVRAPQKDLNQQLGSHEGLLVRHEASVQISDSFLISIDLAELWCRLSGLPFVFMVWAVRPGTLKKQEYQMLNDAFYRAAKARSSLASACSHAYNVAPQIGADFIEMDNHYYLDREFINGLNHFFTEAQHYNLLPRVEYENAALTLLGRESKRHRRSRPLAAILRETYNGKRLGIDDAVKLSKEASIADLGLISDAVRSRMFPERTYRPIYVVHQKPVGGFTELATRLEGAISKGAREILISAAAADYDLNKLCELIKFVSSYPQIHIEACTVEELLKLSEKTSLPDLLRTLKDAGASSVSGMPSFPSRSFSFKDGAERYLSILSHIHAAGLQSSCSLIVSLSHSWEERVLYMDRLRTLQDENGGIRYIFVQFEKHCSEPWCADLVLRVTALARVFMDNLGSVAQLHEVSPRLPGLLSLGFGADQLRILVDDVSQLGRFTTKRFREGALGLSLFS